VRWLFRTAAGFPRHQAGVETIDAKKILLRPHYPSFPLWRDEHRQRADDKKIHWKEKEEGDSPKGAAGMAVKAAHGLDPKEVDPHF